MLSSMSSIALLEKEKKASNNLWIVHIHKWRNTLSGKEMRQPPVLTLFMAETKAPGWQTIFMLRQNVTSKWANNEGCREHNTQE